MSALKDLMVQDLGYIEGQMDQPVFTWNGTADPFKGGTDYPCVPGSAGDMAVLTEGGFQVNLDLILSVRQELFNGSFPKHEQRVKYKGYGFRIYQVRYDSVGAFLRLLLYSDTKGI
jgi:hypothetical protein